MVPFELLLLCHRLRGHNLSKSFQPRCLEPGWGIGLQSSDNTRLGDLVRATVLHVYRSQEEHIALLCDARSDGLHDLAVDGLFVICHQVLVQKFLDLVWRQPAQN